MVGYTFYLRSKGKVFVAKNGSFLEKEFLSKELSGRKIELDEVIEPLLQPESSIAQKDVSVEPASVEEEADDGDHEASDKLLSNLVGRQGHVPLPNGTVTLSWRSCCWTTMNLQAMEKRWWAQILTNGQRP